MAGQQAPAAIAADTPLASNRARTVDLFASHYGQHHVRHRGDHAGRRPALGQRDLDRERGTMAKR